MNGTWRGPLRLPESARRITQYPKVDPLPKQGDPEPRRRRGWVCPWLRIDNEPVLEFRRVSFNGSGSDIQTASCEMRHVAIKGDLVLDLCTSSWARTCCFLPEVEQAA